MFFFLLIIQYIDFIAMAEAVRMSTLGRAVYLGDLYDFTSDSFKHLGIIYLFISL